MSQTSAIAVQDGEIDEPESILELVFLDDLMEELYDMRRRIGEGAAAHGRQHEGIVEIGHSDPQDGSHLVQGNLCLLREHQAVFSDAGAAEGCYGNNRNVVGSILQQGSTQL